MSASIEVRVAGRGTMRDGTATASPSTSGRCDLCGKDADAVVSVTPDASTYACKPCLRDRLDAITVASWTLRGNDGRAGLPWGKFSG